jgi:hypothetical protein
METDFLIDGMLSGTGLRDARNGGYVEPKVVGLSDQLSGDIAAWQQESERAHFAGFPDGLVAKLDEEGLALTLRAQSELAADSIGYFSSGQLKRLS